MPLDMEKETGLIDHRQTKAHHHPTFKGAGRVPTKLGIPTLILVGTVMAVAITAMVAGLVWWLSLLIILPIFAAITRHDDRAFHILALGIRTRFLNRNKRFWNGSSYTPLTYPKRRRWRTLSRSE